MSAKSLEKIVSGEGGGEGAEGANADWALPNASKPETIYK